MHPTLEIALRAARSAANIMLRALDRLDTIKFTQKSPQDYVSEIDRLCENEIINTLRRAYPTHAFLGEETGRHPGDEHLWIIDPLDGTHNFMHGIPFFCISIAQTYKGRLEHGLVYDPIREEAFMASRGRGAQLNGKRIRVAKRPDLNGAIISTGFPHHAKHLYEPYMKMVGALLPQVCGIRRLGAAALDLAYVAAGRLDGYWEFSLKPWDIAAGALLIQEAGGLISDSQGSEKYLDNGNIVTGNPKIFKHLLQLIRPLVHPSKS